MGREAEPEALREELLREISGLESAWKQIAQKLNLDVRARMRELLASLAKGSEPAPGNKRLTAALAEVRALRIKPDKARAKDLGRIDRLLDSLLAILPGPQS